MRGRLTLIQLCMKTVLIYSGGLDSTVLLFDLLKEGHEVKALSVNYGQRHVRELEGASTICANAGVEHRVADLRSIQSLFGANSLTAHQHSIPEGHYAEETMKATVVPNRNMILLSVAAAWAITEKAECISYAAHGGDHAIYPDCRNEFADAMDAALRLADWHEVYLNRPFVNLSKADIVKLGSKVRAPLAHTWSCYKGGNVHCGRCGTCVERREAFYLAGISDPTDYGKDAFRLDALIANDFKTRDAT